MRTTRQEELGKRLVAMMRSGEERREELNTWELANINCKVKDIIEDVKKEGSSSIDNQDIKDVREDGTLAEERMYNMEDGELGMNEVEESPDEVENEGDNEVEDEVQNEVEDEVEDEVENKGDHEVENEEDNEVDMEESSSSAGKVAEEEELETGVSLSLTADDGTAGFLINSHQCL